LNFCRSSGAVLKYRNSYLCPANISYDFQIHAWIIA
jgi:hypothetical protein